MKLFCMRFNSLLVLAVALAAMAVSYIPAHAVTIDMVTVGNPGNGNDPATGSLYGGVNYSYQIGKYDVTIQQYSDFLNAVAKSDSHALWDLSMETDGNIAGISRAGSSGSYTYSVIGSSGNKPITYVSWFDAARFANWMHNGQGSGSTETGAYTLDGAITGNTVAKNAGATFYIPTENEWYKAAYYSPNLNSGSGGYYKYATQSNSDPGNVVGAGPNQANYAPDPGYLFSVTQSGDYDANQNYLTDVGAFTSSASFYGTFDQSGNVNQWTTDYDGSLFPPIRGGSWVAENVSSSKRFTEAGESSVTGFRLASPVAGPASVPEIDPTGFGSVLALVTGALGLVERRRLKAKLAA